ncbi:proton-translocating NADH-quinone oxidoreductase, chain N [delta proteobacterium NaphS2]|nr:proton-translocating NADH-quinone oxidoreductase, chain N [delta proteobacterium NaphS2]
MNIMLLMPELFQLLMVAALFVQSILQKEGAAQLKKWLPWAAALGVIVCYGSLAQNGLLFSGTYRLDNLSQFFKMTVSFGFFLAVINGINQPLLEKEKKCDYFLFMALSAWGLMILCSTVELISIYLALELASFSLFPLVPLRTKSGRAAEASVKYMFIGGVATTVGLFGFSYILAAQHATNLQQLMHMPWTWSHSPMAVMGLILFLSGLLFKLAFFPFHFWAPDVYEGAGNETAAYIAVLPKVGAVAVLLRFSPFLKPGLEVTTILALLAAVSMTYGNLAALLQKDVKRLLGYSAISHAGYLMVGVVAGTPMGAEAAAFYAFSYVLMNFACFWVLCRESKDGKNLMLKDLIGLWERSPGLAFVLAVGAMALVGLPPTAGFMGKFFVLSAAWNRGCNWLVVIAAANVAIALFYYLNLVRYAYTKADGKPFEPSRSPTESGSVWMVSVGLFLAALLILFGILPNPILRMFS